MPYTVGLVLMGLGLAIVAQNSEEIFGAVNLDEFLLPEVILTILVPPLIFEAAFHIKFEDLRRNLKEILTFAFPGVLITMFMVGFLVSWGASIPIEVALIFGALIAATDPVAVVALFRSLGVPKQLLTLLEGESLLNDGIAILIFNLMIAITLGTKEFGAVAFVRDFILIAGGGFLTGMVVSAIVSLIIRQVNNYLIEGTLTIAAAYGSYLIAEELHASGVLAVVAAGLVIGNIGERGMSPTTRLSLFNFWEFFAYISNSFAFLSIGLVIDLTDLLANWQRILFAIAAVLIARAVVIYLFSYSFRNITAKMQHVIYWGGLRGAISLALVLSLPVALGEETRELLQDMTFGVVLFTLLVQGTTMRPIIKRLGFGTRTKNQESYERHQARAVAAQRSYERVAEMHKEGLISEHAWEILDPAMQRQIEMRREVVHEIMHANPNVESAELETAFEEILRTQRSTYNTLLSDGAINEETFTSLVNEIDAALMNQDISYSDLLLRRTADLPPITHMIVATVSEPDVYETLHMLAIRGIPTIRLTSNLGPSTNLSITMIIGAEASQVEEIISTITKCCELPQVRKGNILSLINARNKTKLEQQAETASIFVFDVEHYEEI